MERQTVYISGDEKRHHVDRIILPPGAFDGPGSADLSVDAQLRSYLADTITYNNDASFGDTALSVPVEAGGIYGVELVVHSSNAVKALKLTFGGTATLANFIGRWSGIEQDGPTVAYASDSLNGTFAPTTGFNAGGEILYTFQGSIEVDTAGTFLLQGAQLAADVSDTFIHEGSTLILHKI